MMSSLRICKLILVASLAGFAGCATLAPGWEGEETRPQPPGSGSSEPSEIRLEDVVFKFDRKGNLVPFSVNGVPFKSCESEGPEQCRIFSGRTEVLDVDTITITVIKHKNSPPCLFASSNRGRGGAGGGSVSQACPDQ